MAKNKKTIYNTEVENKVEDVTDVIKQDENIEMETEKEKNNLVENNETNTKVQSLADFLY